MSNIKIAVQALTAELENARAGASHYAAQVEALSDALSKLQAFSGAVAAPAAKRGRPAKAVTANHAKEKTPKRGKRNLSRELPSTGGDYWLNYLTDEPSRPNEILQRAIDALPFIPSPNQVSKLGFRLRSWLKVMEDTKRISGQGERHEHRYSKLT